MSLVIREQSRRDFEPVPAGTHLAVCTAVVDMGVQDDSKYQPRAKVYVRWELPGLSIKWRDKQGAEHSGPMVIGKTYTKSLAPKATLRADLESWRGKTFSAAEFKAFDVASILGAPCMLGIQHHDGADGRTYADVVAVMRAPPEAAPKAAAKLLAYDVDDPNPEMFALLPTWLQKKISARLPEPEREAAKAQPAIADAKFNDDIPF